MFQILEGHWTASGKKASLNIMMRVHVLKKADKQKPKCEHFNIQSHLYSMQLVI